MNKKQALGRIIVRQRRVVKVLEDWLDDDRLNPCPDVPLETVAAYQEKHLHRVERAGMKLYELTGVLIQECDHSSDYPRNL